MLAMAMAAPQQTQLSSASCPAYIPLSSSKDKGKRPLSPSEWMPSSKKGRYFDAVDISSDDSDVGEDEEELAEPFDPSSFYNNASKKPLPDSIENTSIFIFIHVCRGQSGRLWGGRFHFLIAMP